MISLRPYQERVISDVTAAYARGVRRVLLLLPTGGGKTACASVLIARALARGRKVVFAVHVREVVQDTARRLRAAEIHTGVVMAGVRPDPAAPVQVCSVQTLAARGSHPAADFLILDECHHTASRTWRAIALAYPDAWVLGLTATPERGDGAGLGDIFQQIVVGATVSELTLGGYLAPVDGIEPRDVIERGDRPGIALDPVEAVERYAPGRRTIVFASRVAWSREYAVRGGSTWAHLDGQTPVHDRAIVLRRFAEGHTHVLTQVGLISEGVDIPAADCVVLARRYRHPGQYLQSAGRILRVDPARPAKRALIVDLAGNLHYHGLPDVPRSYSLGKDPIRSGARAPSLCPVCGATRRLAEVSCWRCGTAYPAPPPAPRGRGVELVPVVVGVRAERPDAGPAERSSELARLRAVATARGYNPHWITSRYRERFGVYP